jgi:uncharacterized protein (DUF305 family)
MTKSARTVAAAALVVVALAITFALISRSNDNRMNDNHLSGNSTSEFNNADVMFAQMMIPHHEQAIEMSDLVLAKSGVNPEVTALAQQIKAAQQPEIDTMKAWLDAWGHPAMGDRGMQHDSGGGMMTDEEMRQLEQASGIDGQRLFLAGMIRHHEGAIKMAQTEIDAGKNPETIDLARNIATSQQKEIDLMRELLKKS